MMDIFFCGRFSDLLIRPHNNKSKSTCPIVWLLMRLYPQATHYPPLTTLEPYDSDTRIDLDGLLSLVDIWLLLVSCITEHIFVLIGSALPLPYSRSRSLYRCNKSMTSTEHQYVAISSPVLVSSCTTSSSSTATPTHHQYQYPYSSERYLPASPTDSRRVRWIQGTKYSIIVTFLINRHQGEFRLVWRHQSGFDGWY